MPPFPNHLLWLSRIVDTEAVATASNGALLLQISAGSATYTQNKFAADYAAQFALDIDGPSASIGPFAYDCVMMVRLRLVLAVV